MIAICHNCGALKKHPRHECSRCHICPQTPDDIKFACMLTNEVLDVHALAEAAALIRSYQHLNLKSPAQAALLYSLQDVSGRRTPRPLLATRIAVAVALAAIAAVLFFFLHPWPQFEWASKVDSISSYSSFMARFPKSTYAGPAANRIRVLREPEVWTKANNSGDIEALRIYIRAYPDGQHLESAKQQAARLADASWEPIRHSRSEAEIRGYISSYPEASKLAAAEARIQELYDDIDWVKEQDNIDHYQRFVTRHPEHPNIASIEKRIIDLEVRAIAAGEYGELPKAQAMSLGGSSVEDDIAN
jgi:hypothetical protein